MIIFFDFMIKKEMRSGVQMSLAKRKPRAVSSFLKKTYELLNDGLNSDVVRWASNGIGFVVLSEDSFSRETLPIYFKHSNYSSFVRQLNMYNFHKIRENNTESYFHHQFFDRSNEQKLCQIKRKAERKKRRSQYSDQQIFSDENQKEILKSPPIRTIKQDTRAVNYLKPHGTEQKIESQKNTNHLFSSECNEEQPNECPNWKSAGIDQQSDDKLSINNEMSQRILPRLATRELFYPSNNNLFPFGGATGQTSTFCLFY